jgi:hypothetical protein
MSLSHPMPDRANRLARPFSPWRGWCALLGLSALLWMGGCRSLDLFSHDRGDDRVEQRGRKPELPSRYCLRIAPYAFQSDVEIQREQPLFKDLASLRDQVYKELLLPPGASQIQVYLFENRERYEEYIQWRYPELPPRRAFFVAQPRTMGGTEDLLVYTYRSERIRQDLRHELTHALLHSVIKEVPIWLDEGLAEYFELPQEKQGVNSGHLELLRRGSRPDLARLEGLKEVGDMNPAEYREAWAWVHLMLRTRPEARTVLLSYLQQLRGNRHPGSLRSHLARVYPEPEATLATHLSSLSPGGDQHVEAAPVRAVAR